MYINTKSKIYKLNMIKKRNKIRKINKNNITKIIINKIIINKIINKNNKN